jgi:hypothetical protein
MPCVKDFKKRLLRRFTVKKISENPNHPILASFEGESKPLQKLIRNPHIKNL